MAHQAITLPLNLLRKPRPCVPGMRCGQVVTTRYGGRRFRVTAVDEWVITHESGNWAAGDLVATGPYCRLQALDDNSLTVIYPRAWYVTQGQQIDLFEEAV